MKTKYLFVVGGVMSGVGKGTSTAALALSMQAQGYKVTAIKIDPYVNMDAGTMNPIEHGEVFVTVDGDETDQDIGIYERYLGIDITSVNYMTTGRVYQSVINRERNLEYGGKCVEVVPHVPEEVILRIETAAAQADADIAIIEIGGTVGEYQNILFLEAARMMQGKYPGGVGFVLVSYLPVPPSVGEMKTKPTQYAVRTLNATGILPNFIICRSPMNVDEPRKQKIAQFCSVPVEHVIAAPDAKSVYDIPDTFQAQDFSGKVLRYFGLQTHPLELTKWNDFVARLRGATQEVRIAVIGKYFSTGDFTLSDAYISVIEAIKHAGAAVGVKPKIEWLNSEAYENDPSALEELKQYQGVIIPGGFGSRGIEGKIKAIQYVRENKIPYLGLCYGMQCAVIEYARNILGWTDAQTEEINPSSSKPVIHLQAGQEKNIAAGGKMGATMRLGAYPCVLKEGSMSAKAYGATEVSERHRHRYEFNNDYRQELEDAGLVISGTSPDNHFVEIVEVKDHPFFVGVQFHPEFQSRPLEPHPLFVGLMKAASEK
jgi:CTP synthase